MRKIFLLVCCFLILVGCSKEKSSSSEPISSFDNSAIISEIDSNTPENTNSSTPSNQETSSDNSQKNPTLNPTVPPKPDSNKNDNDLSQTVTDINGTDNINETSIFSNLSMTYSGYISNNENKPYLKGKAIYDILYSGSRAQVGDTLCFTVEATPSNANDTVVVTTSDNLSYTLSGSKLSVTVNSTGNYDNGFITVSSKQNPNLQKTHRISVDISENPYKNFSSVLSEYIAVKGMKYTLVEKGYTTDNPSLSITHYAGAPTWDDQILKTNSEWILKSLTLIDEYKKLSFNKVNFIITETELGFSASK